MRLAAIGVSTARMIIARRERGFSLGGCVLEA